MKRSCILLAVSAFGLLLPGCGGDQRQTRYGTVSEIKTYLKQIRPILQEIRLINQQLSEAVPSDSVAAEVIVPLLEVRFRPALASLYERARKIERGEKLEEVHRQLLEFLRLQLEAFDLAIQGGRENRPELFEQFGLRQASADSVGLLLSRSIQELRRQYPY